jgi:hypothetical protein
MRKIFIIFGLIGTLLAAQAMVSLASDPEPTPDPFPRPTDWEIIVAEQVFENGRMFYLAPNSRIWVMIESEDDETTGEWLVFADTWEEGTPEFDPEITPPDGLHQPIRGFGELWRNSDEIRDALGWALDPEIGHLSRYQFFEGEVVETDDGMMQLPGTHALLSTYGRTFLFDEAEGTWSVLEQPGEEDDSDDDEMAEAVEPSEEEDSASDDE